MSGRRAGGERGSGAVLALTVVAVLGVVTLVAVSAAAVALARHRAETAADLGALAAADGVGLLSDQQACEQARSVVGANEATLESCVVDGAEVVVVAQVWVVLPLLLGGGRAAVHATARAGREPGPSATRPSVGCRYRDICGPTHHGA